MTMMTELVPKYEKKLTEVTSGSFYGKNVWIGLHSSLERSSLMQKLKILSGTIFGSYLFTFTTYFSFDGAIRIVKWSIEQRIEGEPLPSDIGHGGEWIQQPLQNFLVIHLLYLSTMANQGQLARVTRIYDRLAKKIAALKEGDDLSKLYRICEQDLRTLARRSFISLNMFQIKQELLKIFQSIDTAHSPCRTLDWDRALEGDYKALSQKLKALESITPFNTLKNWRIGYRHLCKRGLGQALEKSAFFTFFQGIMLFSSLLLLLGLGLVIDEVFLSQSGEESSGHLSEWILNIFTNFGLIYFSYYFLIKKEALLIRTRRVMAHFLEEKEDRSSHLVKVMNKELDERADRCHFTHLPSSYRLESDDQRSRSTYRTRPQWLEQASACRAKKREIFS